MKHLSFNLKRTLAKFSCEISSEIRHYIFTFRLLKYPIYISTCFRNKNKPCRGVQSLRDWPWPVNVFAKKWNNRSFTHSRSRNARYSLFTRLTKKRQCRCKSGSGLRAVFHWPIERSRALNPLLLLYTLMNFVRAIFHFF